MSQSVADAFQYPLDVMPVPEQLVGEYYAPHYGRHLGVDLPAAAGTPVHAIANGVVKYWGWIECLGDAVVIEHTRPDASKRVSVYYHIEKTHPGKTDVVLGQTVTRGQIIGYVRVLPKKCGTGDHLHFGIRPGAHKATDDCRTGVWFYPGYTSLHVKSCQNPPLPYLKDPIDDPSDPRHGAILAEWDNNPLAFIANNLPAPLPSSIVYQPGPEGFDTVYGTVYAPGPNGDAETLYDGGWGDYYYDFFRWDLSSLPPADSVSQVLLYLYFNATGNDPTFQVQRVTSPWDEAALTRTNYPTATTWGNWTGITTTGWYSLDITDLYKNWKNGTWPNYGIELAPTAIIQTNGSIISSDYQADPTLRPKLVITTSPVFSEF